MTSADASSGAAPAAPDEPAEPADIGTDTALHRFENVEFDELQGQLRVAGQPVALEPRPLRLLAELLQHVNEVVTKDELLQAVWDGRPTVEHVLANAVSKLRTALGAAGAARLVTLPRVGYRLQGPVQRETRQQALQRFAAGQEVPGRKDFVLERALGQGSRSDVWLARHARLGHTRVFKFADDGARLSALKREYTLYRVLRQELGQRADIATVVDSRFTAAPYFLECEYGGQSLPEWAEQDGRLAAMSQSERLQLFLQIARAVAAAHSVGVLHKDLKPGNILVDAAPGQAGQAGLAGLAGQADHPVHPPIWQARLTDFGSGRLLDAGRLADLQLTALGMTHTEHVTPDSHSGTLMYLAPEVLAGQAPSMQSDVYALGLVLYQMLVGDLRRPMATGWQRSLDDALLVDDVAAATEGRLADRLASAAELAHRLEHLPQRRVAGAAAQAEIARQQRQAEQLARTRARRPWVAVALCGLAVGLGFSLWQQREARAAQGRAEAAQREAAAVNDFLTKDLLVSPDFGRAIGPRPVSMLELLRRGSVSAGGRFAGQPLLEAAARHHLARTFAKLWNMSDAEAEYARAIALLQPLVPPSDDKLLHMQFEYVNVLVEMRELTLATQIFEDATRAAGPARLAARSQLAFLAHGANVAVLFHGKRQDEAIKEARRAVELADTLPGMDAINRIDARRVLAHTLALSGDVAASEQVLAELASPPLSLRPESLTAASWVYMLRASVLRDAGRFTEAEPMLLDVQRRLAKSPVPSAWHQGYAHSELGHLYNVWRRREQAAAQYKEAINYFRPGLGEDHQFTRTTELNLTEMLVNGRRYAQALEVARAAEPWFKTRALRGGSAKLEVLIGRSLIGVGRPAEAMHYLEPHAKPGPGDLPAGGSDFAWAAQAYRGIALVAMGQRERGLALVREAEAVLAQAKRLPSEQPDLDDFLARRH